MDIDSPYPVSDEQIEFFRANGFVKLKNVLAPEVLAYYGDEITRKVLELNAMHLPMSERTTYQKAFLQVMMLWQASEVVQEFVFGKRLARLATELLGVEGVRLYSDQALYKEPGGGFTPWHADQFYWPVATEKICTVWVPLQETTLEMGPLSFARKSHTFTSGRDQKIGNQSEAKISAALARHNFEIFQEPFALGEVSYHYGWTFHRAGPNETAKPRQVMTIIYMDAAMRLKAPENQSQHNDWQTHCPGAEIGEVIDTPYNPILYHR